LRVPTSSFLCDWTGGAIRVAPTGPNFDVRPGGVTYAAPVGLPHGVSRSGCSNATLTGVTPVPRRSSLLGRLGPSSHGLPQLRGLRHCGVARAPVLRAFAGAIGAASLATAPELEIGEKRLRLAGLGDRLNECNE